MGFFDSLRRVLGRETSADRGEIAAAWGLQGSAKDESEGEPGLYDRAQWHKKLKRILDELPGSRHEWDELMAEARSLQFDPDWVTRCQVDEFLLLIRRAVADGHFTEPEHLKLDLARDLIGIPEAEAEEALHSVVAEAESFFGKSVEGA